jgi:hypothetical protein
VPVDPITGGVAISIPIWQISEGDLSAQVSISYSGNGIKVEEVEGSAGMSWNLNVQIEGYLKLLVRMEVNSRSLMHSRSISYGNKI